ncbi:permease [Chromobacterium sp.]|uniref:permease n=1 Tax=Chromobacterium sp. TaxID=306190 RepID=UPI0035AEE1F3
MPLSIFAPLAYLLIGLGLGRAPFDVKARASALLSKWVIPLVIIYNIATHRPGVFTVMAGIAAIMALLLLLGRRISRDPVHNLCFCYLNIGWLGLPVASALFGDGAAMVIIAAYVGSSLFGNAIGVGLLAQGQHWRARLRQTLQAPPVWALLVGLACLPLGPALEHYARPGYEALKWLMSFLGMAILGIWLSGARLRLADFKLALRNFAARAVALALLLSLFILLCGRFDIALVTENRPTLYLLCLLPPAANIIVLETHYLKSGRSAGPIACGTCVSLLAIGVYVAVMLTH